MSIKIDYYYSKCIKSTRYLTGIKFLDNTSNFTKPNFGKIINCHIPKFIMEINVDEKLFLKLAKDLKTTPENIIKIFLEHASNLPHSVLIDACSKEDNSLDKALSKLMINSQAAFVAGDLIEEITDDHKYTIENVWYEIDKDIIGFNIVFLDGIKKSIDKIFLQFGNDSGVLILASMDDLVLDKDVKEFLDEIFFVLNKSYNECEFWYEWSDSKYLRFEIGIDSTKMINLPKIDDLTKIVKKIKKIIKSHDDRKKLT